ncbi:Translation initiation factor 3 subunit J component [Pyricularia grisea]|nr:Translation initiation factor 3 subunit J component [Pyricularia grisea]
MTETQSPLAQIDFFKGNLLAAYDALDIQDEESSSGSSEESSPAVAVSAPRRKFDDEEANDSDVLDSWDAAEDSEVEREKAKKAAEAKAKAEAEAAAKKKSKAARINEHKQRRKEAADSDESDDETEAQRRERLRRTEKEADLAHAEDLFGDIGVPSGRKVKAASTSVSIDPSDPSKTVELSDLPIFNPKTKTQFEDMRQALIPLITASSGRKPHYNNFMEEFVRQLCTDMPSENIKKISSKLTALSNEKMKQEKAAAGTKKTKAAKTKTSLVANRAGVTDTNSYEDTFGDDDFM